MIITASRRTDIPAFYSEWLMKRIEAGFFINVNPFNSGQRRRISLLPEAVETMVFLTKNPGPLLPHLGRMTSMGYRYYFHYTLNNYPALFEPGLPPVRQRVALFQQLSRELGPEKVIWRYDPVIISNRTPVSQHLENFTVLAESLRGYTDQVIISLLQVYAKVGGRLQRLQAQHGLEVIDIRDQPYREDLKRLASGLSETARANRMLITSCAERCDLREYGIEPGACVDRTRIQRLFGVNLPTGRDKSQRPYCRCAPAVDLGVYDTCKFNCCYCYATRSERAVLRKIAGYDVNGVALGEPEQADDKPTSVD